MCWWSVGSVHRVGWWFITAGPCCCFRLDWHLHTHTLTNIYIYIYNHLYRCRWQWFILQSVSVNAVEILIDYNSSQQEDRLQMSSNLRQSLLRAADWLQLESHSLLRAADWLQLESHSLLRAADWLQLESHSLLRAADRQLQFHSVPVLIQSCWSTTTPVSLRASPYSQGSHRLSMTKFQDFSRTNMFSRTLMCYKLRHFCCQITKLWKQRWLRLLAFKQKTCTQTCDIFQNVK